MQTKTLYKYKRADGGMTVSPVKPSGDYTELYRLIADEGKRLTKDGVELFLCVDVETTEGWYEVDAPIEPEEPEEPDQLVE